MSEHQDQAALFEWAAWNQAKHPELRWLHAIPNGGGRSRAEAGRLKAEGVRAGVADVHLPYRRAQFIGLYLELKTKGKYPTPDQAAFLSAMTAAGHKTAIVRGPDEAIAALQAYLALPEC